MHTICTPDVIHVSVQSCSHLWSKLLTPVGTEGTNGWRARNLPRLGQEMLATRFAQKWPDTKIGGPVKDNVVVGHRVAAPTAASFPAAAPSRLLKRVLAVLAGLPLVHPRAHFLTITVVP